MIQQLQLTVFVPGPPLAVLNVLATVFPGVTPKAFQNQGPQQMATLEIGGFQVTIASQPERIDFVIAPPEPPLPPLSATVELDFREASRLMVPAVGAFASAQANAQRLAVILNAAREVGSTQESVEVARNQIPNLQVPDGTSEIDYKINVPCPSSIDGITLNRLHRWFSAARAVVEFVITHGGPSVAPVQELSWALVEIIDINTTTESKFESRFSLKLFEEMITQAETLYERGYEAFT